MPPSLLFVDNRGGATPATCFLYTGATPATFGDTFGTRWSDTGANPWMRHGAKQYRGNIYAVASDGVYVKDDPTSLTGSWTQSLAFTNPEQADGRCSGLHIIYVNDEPILVVVYGDDTANTDWRWAKFDGSTWSNSPGATGVGGVVTDIIDVIVYRNVLHVLTANSSVGDAFTFDPASESFSLPAEPFPSFEFATSLCVFNDRLFALYQPGTTGPIRLAEFSGGAWSEVVGSAAPDNTFSGGGSYQVAKWALFTDGTNLYGITAGIDQGWRCWQWDGTLATPTNIGPTVLPASLRGSTDGGTFSTGIQLGRFVAILDQDTAPSTADILLYSAANGTAGTILTQWNWNGNGSVITQVDTGGDVFHAIPTGLNYSGEHIFVAGELDIVITGKDAVVGGERIRFRAYGAAGAADKTVRMYFNTEGEPALTQCTLTGVSVVSGSPAGAPTLGANEANNIDADPSVEYGVIWDIGTDGVSAGDRVQVKAQLSV